jgi:hypothetical protein
MALPLVASENLSVSAEIAFSRICSIQTWPVWLSFVRRAEFDGYPGLLTQASDIVLASDLSAGMEEVFEVEELIEPYLLTLVGAFSCRRRIQFRVDRKDDVSRLTVRIAYSRQGGLLQGFVARFLSRRKLNGLLAQSLQTFKSLVEHDAEERAERHEHAAALMAS